VLFFHFVDSPRVWGYYYLVSWSASPKGKWPSRLGSNNYRSFSFDFYEISAKMTQYCFDIFTPLVFFHFLKIQFSALENPLSISNLLARLTAKTFGIASLFSDFQNYLSRWHSMLICIHSKRVFATKVQLVYFHEKYWIFTFGTFTVEKHLVRIAKTFGWCIWY
jgi:hypothetical protein